MAFLSKILFKPNKVLEILSFVCIYYIFKCNVKHRRRSCVMCPDNLMFITAHFSMKTNGTVVQNNCQSLMCFIDQTVILSVALEGFSISV